MHLQNAYRLKSSTIVLLVLIGMPSIAAAQQLEQQFDVYRQYALTHSGDSQAGEQLFRTEKGLACTACHRVTGVEKCGPNLDGIADKYARTDLIEQILRPSKTIKPGYEQTIVTTTNGRTIIGRINRSQKEMLKLIDAEGRIIDVLREDIGEVREAPVSMMPDNVALTISREQFADLIAYLETLHLEITTGFGARDQPVEVPRLKRPVGFELVTGPDTRFDNPVWCDNYPGVPGEMIVLEHQECKAWRLTPSPSGMQRELFVDLTGQVRFGANWGLMSIAFHPNFKTNRRYFLEHEVAEDKVVKTTVVERTASGDLMHDSGAPSRRLFAVEQPAYAHNGGCLAFGPDGMLYFAFGDGGIQTDPQGNSQNLSIAHGSMMRIDVDHRDEGLPYAIPPDNPFLEKHRLNPEVLAETWAIGFREPWRFSFDSMSGDLWLGDVGQDKYEEVCLVRRGENHGWNVYEGYEPFSDEYRQPEEKYTAPVFAYPHSFGGSVTGGVVYRGSQSPSFEGIYIFGDYETRKVWGLKHDAGKLVAVRELGDCPQHMVSFGADNRGEIYIVGYEGSIYHLVLHERVFE